MCAELCCNKSASKKLPRKPVTPVSKRREDAVTSSSGQTSGQTSRSSVASDSKSTTGSCTSTTEDQGDDSLLRLNISARAATVLPWKIAASGRFFLNCLRIWVTKRTVNKECPPRAKKSS